jgi:uncharacterized protein YyaL (SSP411 family)
MFLTADGKPIAGGTYWPRDDRQIQGQTAPGFLTILNSVVEAQQQVPENLRKTAELRAAQTRQLLAVTLRPSQPLMNDRDLVTLSVSYVVDAFDEEYGGFGAPPAFRGPKFPHPPYLKLLESRAKTQPALSLVVDTSLEMMARGGIYDQLGGGFHRYTVERTWTVPHFEKMLYDNAQLLEVYAQAYQRTKNPLYRRVMEETLDFVRQELTSKEGVFFTSLDADSEGREGRYYVWTTGELSTALKDDVADLELVTNTYGAARANNFEDEFHILVLENPVADAKTARLQELRQRLLAVRAKRPRPSLDTKVLTSWNGLMIAGMAAAGKALEDPAAIEHATRAADFLLKTMKTPDGHLFHTYAAVPGEPAKPRVEGYLDDYTHLAHGLLTLHDVTGDARWLTEAKSLTDTMVSLFHDEAAGGFYFTAAEHELLFARMKDEHDGVQPCGNSQAAANLVRLWKKTGDDKYRQLAEETFRTFAASMQDEPRGMCTMTTALNEYLDATAK